MFTPDFIQIPYHLIIDEELQPADRIVYGIIYWIEHLKEGTCYASNALIGQIARISPDSVRHALDRLESGGYIKRTFKDPQRRVREKIICRVAFRQVGLFEPTRKPVTSAQTNRQVGSNDPHIKNSNILSNIYSQLLEFWNQKSIIIHKKVTAQAVRAIQTLLKDFNEDEIKKGIENYATILKSPRTYFKHKWTFEEFLQRKNGCRQFIFKSESDYLTDVAKKEKIAVETRYPQLPQINVSPEQRKRNQVKLQALRSKLLKDRIIR